MHATSDDITFLSFFLLDCNTFNLKRLNDILAKTQCLNKFSLVDELYYNR